MAETKATINELQSTALSGTGSATTNYTVSATSFTEVSTDFRVTLTVPSTSSIILCTWDGSWYGTDGTTYLRVALGYDSTVSDRGTMANNPGTEVNRQDIHVTDVFTGLAAGSHIFKVFARRTTTNATLLGLEGSDTKSALKVIIIP